MKIKLISLIVCLMLSSTTAFSDSKDFPYGIYSNMTSQQGELSGVEVYILNDGRPGKYDISAIVQIAEGWPQYPEIIDCCGCSVNNIKFKSKKLGEFVGVVKDGYLSGEFIEAKYKISLEKGLSHWQKN